MFKSAVPSVAPSASASASSHDTHSLPPAFKGPVQRFLAVSLPTITLTPEFIDILDAVDVPIPSRLQVTIRWWNEDSASSLSVYPKLNSPLSPSIEAHQSFLRQQRLDKEKALQLQQQQQQGLQQQKQEQEQEQERQQNPLSTTAGNSAQPSLPTQTQQRSMAAKFLRRPLTGGARLMNVFRIGTNKRAKDSKASNVKTPLSSTALENDTAALRGNDLPDTDKRRQDDHPDRVGIPTPTPNPTTAPTPAPPRPPAEAKPLPTLPDAAYPVTVAYPVRCSLDQLYRYFLEMTSLTLEIQIAPNLIVLASVPNLADLFRNIHGTFSGVFPFTTVLLNDNPQLATQKIFSRRSVLGMVVFQAWSQDTSDIGDTSEESESGSFGSVHPDNDDNNNNNTDEQPAAYHRQHYPHGSIHHHRQHSHHQPVDHPAGYHRHPPQPQPPPLQTPTYPQQPPYRLRPSLGIPSKQSQPIYPLNPNTIMDPATLLQQQRQRAAATSPHGQHHRGGSSYNQQPSSGSRHRDTHGHQPSLRFDDESMAYRPRRFPSYPHPHAIGPSAMPYEDRYREGRGGGGGRQQVTTGAAGVCSFGPSRQFPIAKLPASDLGPPHDGTYRRFARSSVQRPSQDESAFRYRRSEGTNTTTHHSQNSRSRPRSGATAAAIGRLDSVLARGEDLLQGMKTSLALDPEEVRMRSARHLRSSALRDDQDDSRFRPYHESLPYWPSKSRFSLELSIPTAYLTSHGLLKGSKPKKHHSLPLEHTKHRQSQRPQQQQQQQQHPTELTTTASAAVVVSDGLTRSPRHIRKPSRNSHGGQEFWGSMRGSPPREDVGAGSGSSPRGLRRAGKPIQLEKVARMSDLARLQLAQEESAHAHYQSFQTTGGSSSSRQQEASWQEKEQRRRRKDGSSSGQPRKSKSYPPTTFATMGESSGGSWRQHRRRLSSNDRLQIRMNPRPGDLLNDTPDLFPSRSMSGLVRPEFRSSVTGSSFSGGDDESINTGQSSSMGTEEDDSRYGVGVMGGRQSRLQRRRKVPSEEDEEVEEDVDEKLQRRRARSQDRWKDSRRKKRKNQDPRPGQGRGKRQGGQGVHAQHFNFKAQCQLMLTPDIMAACMLENISVEVWKLNPKRQTMVELGSAKLPLHKVLSRILQKTATAPGGTHSPGGRMWGAGRHQDPYYGAGAAAAGARSWQQQQQQQQRGGGGSRGGSRAAGTFKEGWRLEPSLYDIRSRQGTVIGQLDADVWIHPRSRSDSMVSAAA